MASRPPRERKTILVLYYTRGVYPLRRAISDHLYCWKRYSRHRTIYVNVAMGFPLELLRDLRIDAIIYHTSFCGMRWSRTAFHNFTELTAFLDDHPATKIAIPQDEFTNTDLLCEFLGRCSVDYVLTCAYDDEWESIYGALRKDRVRFKTVLTGYLDDGAVKRSRRYAKPLSDRRIDLSYRAWRAAYWLGEHAQHKIKVGEVFRDAAAERGLNVDVSLDDAATLLGDDWLRFLGDSRATVGVEGGASLLDRDDTVRRRVERFLKVRPDATFEETRTACFDGLDGRFKLSCISPRHLEAVATKTCQILVEGEYNNILVADRHYIPVRPDYSNVDEALDKLADDAAVRTMVERAYDEVVAPGRFTYRGFVREIEAEILDVEPAVAVGRRSWLARWVLAARDWVNWRLIQAEVALGKSPDPFWTRVFAKARAELVHLPSW